MANSNSFEREKLVGAGIEVFGGFPGRRDPVSGGVIPENTEIKVLTIGGWPHGRRGHVRVRVLELRTLATDPKKIISASEISVGGMTINLGELVYIPKSVFNPTESTRLPRPQRLLSHPPHQLRLKI